MVIFAASVAAIRRSSGTMEHSCIPFHMDTDDLNHAQLYVEVTIAPVLYPSHIYFTPSVVIEPVCTDWYYPKQEVTLCS